MRVTAVVPTYRRLRYLGPVLADLAGQERGGTELEILVVDDDPARSSRRLVAAFAERSAVPVTYLAGPGRSLNGARNVAIGRARGELLAFVDDDCRLGPGWLRALVAGAETAPEAECFAGPIRPLLPPGRHGWCGREPFPLTTLDLGEEDRWSDVAYGANMAMRAAAFERVGGFDEARALYGDELEWMIRLRRAGGYIRYLAAAEARHVRHAEDLDLPGLARVGLRRGRSAADLDHDAGMSRPLRPELRSGLRLLAHAARRRCWVAVVHALERLAYVRRSARHRGDVRL